MNYIENQNRISLQEPTGFFYQVVSQKFHAFRGGFGQKKIRFDSCFINLIVAKILSATHTSL